jgi:hypothetical protein
MTEPLSCRRKRSFKQWVDKCLKLGWGCSPATQPLWTPKAAGLSTMRGRKKDSLHRVCDCPAMACKRYRTLRCTFLKSEDLENMRVNGLRSLVANTRLGIIP